MALNEYSYGTVVGVHRRIGWIVEGRAFFDGESQPTFAEVEGTIDDIASEIHTELANAGYPIATNASLTTNQARVQRWLQTLNENGAAAMLAQLAPIAGDSESGRNSPASFWQKKYKDGLEQIAKGGLDSLGLSRTTTNADMLFSGSSEDSSGNDKLPIFKRDTFDYPASRSLTDG